MPRRVVDVTVQVPSDGVPSECIPQTGSPSSGSPNRRGPRHAARAFRRFAPYQAPSLGKMEVNAASAPSVRGVSSAMHRLSLSSTNVRAFKDEAEEIQDLRAMLCSGPRSHHRPSASSLPTKVLPGSLSAAERAKQSAEASAMHAAAAASNVSCQIGKPPLLMSATPTQPDESLFSYALVDGITVCESERASASVLQSSNARCSARSGPAAQRKRSGCPASVRSAQPLDGAISSAVMGGDAIGDCSSLGIDLTVVDLNGT